MTTARRRRTVPATALVLLSALSALLAGCSGEGPEPRSCSPAEGLVIVAGAHANMPAPAVPRALACTIQETVAAGRPISVVAVDGNPRAVLTNQVFEVTTTNPDALADDIAAGERAVVAAVTGATAEEDGSDVLAAAAIARDLAVSAGTGSATIVFLDSMLPDRGALQMTAPGMLTADPGEVADFLAATGVLPDMSGLHVQIVGGGYTAPPQEPLTPTARTAVLATWEEVFTRAGAADVAVVPTPRDGDGPETPFTVRPVDVPKPVVPDFCSDTPIVYDNASPVGFLPGVADFRDEQAAREALSPVATWLAADPRRKALLTGTTARWGPVDGQRSLAAERATRAADLLVDLGAGRGQLSPEGVGSDFPEYVADVLPDGTLDPAAAERNRTVRITLSDPASSC